MRFLQHIMSKQIIQNHLGFFKGCHVSDDDYGTTIDDIEKRLFAFNCQQKKLNGNFI